MAYCRLLPVGEPIAGAWPLRVAQRPATPTPLKLYAADERDLSRAPTLDLFLRRYRQFIRNCVGALKTGGKLAILMGLCDRPVYVLLWWME